MKYTHLDKAELIRLLEERDQDTTTFITSVVDLLKGMGIMNQHNEIQVNARNLSGLFTRLLSGNGLASIGTSLQPLSHLITKYSNYYNNGNDQTAQP